MPAVKLRSCREQVALSSLVNYTRALDNPFIDRLRNQGFDVGLLLTVKLWEPALMT